MTKIASGIEIPVNVTVSTETARVCQNLLDIYYGEPVHVVNLEMLAERLIDIQKKHGYNILLHAGDDKNGLEWLINEMEQVCLIPVV